ncbi:sulfatase [Pedobacter glucosidilyticus]|uniref:sulfatase n=1 Tax=Pedobacter glucosidilyticus TaxID=1122941 RepID=UPI0004129F19|nr:sulfatase [Pedobacter glucosidilyticus]
MKRNAIITALFSVFCLATQAQEVAKPNIMFFLVDDLGWADTEPYGSKFYETPNIKKLAQDGLLFTQAYAANPVCSPTRASIMSGKYPSSIKATNWFGAPQPDEELANLKTKANNSLLSAAYHEDLPLKEVTIAEALKSAGYKTFFAGKWHLGETEDFWPEHQGFDINKGGYHSGSPKSYFSPYKNPRLTDGPVGEHLPDRLATETNQFIQANSKEPFFAVLSFYSVHNPLAGRKDLLEKYEAKKKAMGLKDEFGLEGKFKLRLNQSHATYAAVVEGMDLAVGKVMQKLKDLGLEDNTIIVFFSDNGGLAINEGTPTSNFPLRAGKGWLYEGGIREPLIVKWPKVIKAGSRTEIPVISNDFYATFLAAAKLPLMPKQHTGSTNLLPLLKGQHLKERTLFWHYPHYSNQGGSPGSAVRKGDWKLIRWYETGKEELFNLKDDISEQNNLLTKEPKIAKSLSKALNKWLKREKALFPTEYPAYPNN